MRFIAGFITGVLVATIIIVGPYNVASSVAAFTEFVKEL